MALDTSPRTYRFLPADILTSGYRLVGKVMAGTTGVLGMLNDSTHSTLEVHDARMARLHMPTKLVDHFEVVRMNKSRVHALCMARREDLGPQALVRGGYTNITEYPARITTQVFEIEGVLWTLRFHRADGRRLARIHPHLQRHTDSHPAADPARGNARHADQPPPGGYDRPAGPARQERKIIDLDFPTTRG